MTLHELTDWLEKQDPKLVVKDGFGSPHSDRGYYENLAFTPQHEGVIGSMLEYAKMANGAVFYGYKGGDYKMGSGTKVFIGEWGSCGESITSTHFKYWLETGRAK